MSIQPRIKGITKVLTVRNKLGIHARPAAMIVRIAGKYNDTEMWVEKNGEEVNGKSIMGLMMLAVAFGECVTFRACGPHAEKLLDEQLTLFESKFEEA